MKFLPLYACAFILFLAGCEGGGGNAKVSGKVTADGAAVTSGNLTFAPVGGGVEPMTAAIKSDGTYVVDGVASGKCRVMFAASGGAEPITQQPGDAPKVTAFAGYTVKTAELELKSGDNKVDVDLAAPPK